MGEAKRRKQLNSQKAWPSADNYWGAVDLHVLPPVASANAARIPALINEGLVVENTKLILNAFRAIVGERTFYVGHCLGNETGFSPVGIAVIDRLMMETPGATLHVVTVVHEDIAWDTVLRHLRSFIGQVLLFAFSNSDVYDAGTAEIFYSKDIRLFGPDGSAAKRLTAAQRRRIREEKARILNRPPPPTLYEPAGVALEDTPWIFRFATPEGKILRTAVWNGRRNYAHELPEDIIEWVGGNKIAIVQVDTPVGVNLRSSVNLTHRLAKDFDGIIHWARDTETFQSIIRSFIRLEFESVSRPETPKDWKPKVTMFGANKK
jgi:hypothetical protein